MSSKEEDGPRLEAQESLLYSSRHGELSVVKALLEARRDGKITLDINCKGVCINSVFYINYKLLIACST